MMISYSQNAEDVVLARTFWDVPVGFYVDVGAWDPTADSVTKHFYDRGWSGINIEPQPDLKAKFDEDRPRDINLQVAISSEVGEARLLVPPLSALATLNFAPANPAVAVHYENSREILVPTAPLSQILAEHAGERVIHFLKIDVEGLERVVLESTDIGRFRPLLVMLESTLPCTTTPDWESWEPILLSQGYRFTLFDGLNRFYVREDQPVLIERASAPPNLFDVYKSVAQLERDAAAEAVAARLAELEAENAELRARLQAL